MNEHFKAGDLAYSPLYNCIMSITRVFKDSNGKPVIVASNTDQELLNILFRESELEPVDGKPREE